MKALLKEISLRANQSAVIETVYLGGGTPSLLNSDDLAEIFSALAKKFQISKNAEITLEANPDDISKTQLAMWKEKGINRLSIGVQSFFEEDLKWMNRAHNAEEASTCIKEAQDAGFDNLSIDLIYGTPGLSDEKWHYNVQTAIDLHLPHLSCYALTIEPKTALHKLIEKKKMQDTDPEQQSRQFVQLICWLNNAGYEHYEISNFSLPGKRSRHNTAYWQNKPYWGFGPSAHSFNGSDTRSWNIANNALYTASLKKDILPEEKETLTPTQQLNEYIMTALRTLEGIDLQYTRERFGIEPTDGIIHRANRYLNNKIVLNYNIIRLTEEGKLFADGIAADLFEG